MADHSFHLEKTFWWPVWNTRAKGNKAYYFDSGVYGYMHVFFNKIFVEMAVNLGIGEPSSLLHLLSRLFHVLNDLCKKQFSSTGPLQSSWQIVPRFYVSTCCRVGQVVVVITLHDELDLLFAWLLVFACLNARTKVMQSLHPLFMQISMNNQI